MFIGYFALQVKEIGNIRKKSWSAIIEHAKSCVIDDYKLYSYHTIEQPIALLFNSIYELVAVTFDGQNYYSPDTLTPSHKVYNTFMSYLEFVVK